MDTKEVIIDDKTMEMLREISERNGRSLEEEVQKYHYYITHGRKKIAEMGMSPALATLVAMRVKVPADDFDWRKDVEEELYEEYNQ